MYSKGIKVPALNAEEARRGLLSKGLFDIRFRIGRLENSVVIPVLEFAEVTGPHEFCYFDFEERVGCKTGRQNSAPSSFDIIGTKALVKCRNMNEDEKREVADAIISSNSYVDSVFEDAGVSGPFRIRRVRLLAGKGGTETEHREHGMRFRLDISRTFFSPRLSQERKRIALSVRKGERVLDMFAGVGPFSLLCSKANEDVRIVALDLNPFAVSYMRENARMNRADIRSLYMDAAEFNEGAFDRIIMNLPAEGGNYLDHALELLGDKGRIDFYALAGKGDVGGLSSWMEGRGLSVMECREVKGYSPDSGIYHFTLHPSRHG